jgi:hypothetical protein
MRWRETARAARTAECYRIAFARKANIVAFPIEAHRLGSRERKAVQFFGGEVSRHFRFVIT